MIEEEREREVYRDITIQSEVSIQALLYVEIGACTGIAIHRGLSVYTGTAIGKEREAYIEALL